MRSYDEWEDLIRSKGEELGLDEGYKILYCPWEDLGTTDMVFLSLNPGKAPEGADLFTLSDERGNSYEVERFTTKSPLTDQFLQLARFIGVTPRQMLTGVVAPYRSKRWLDHKASTRNAALKIGQEFWTEAFALQRPKTVICCCPEARKMSCEVLNATPDREISSGWGNTVLRRYRAESGSIIVQLPHLSTFKLLSRDECHAPLKDMLDVD